MSEQSEVPWPPREEDIAAFDKHNGEGTGKQFLEILNTMDRILVSIERIQKEADERKLDE